MCGGVRARVFFSFSSFLLLLLFLFSFLVVVVVVGAVFFCHYLNALRVCRVTARFSTTGKHINNYICVPI